MYNDKGIYGAGGGGSAQGIKIAADSIAYCPSGLIDQNKGHVLSYLHKAIKPVNQLRMIEDALVIYRISRRLKEEYSILMLVTYRRLRQNNI